MRGGFCMGLQKSSRRPTTSRKTPKIRRSRAVSSQAARKAPAAQVGSPARTHQSSACFSTRPWRKCPHRAGRAQQTKYSRFTPPA